MATDVIPAAVPDPTDPPEQSAPSAPSSGMFAMLAPVAPARPTPDATAPGAGADGADVPVAGGTSAAFHDGAEGTSRSGGGTVGPQQQRGIWRAWLLAGATRWSKGGGAQNKRLDMGKAKAQAHQVKENRQVSVNRSGGLAPSNGKGATGPGGAGGKGLTNKNSPNGPARSPKNSNGSAHNGPAGRGGSSNGPAGRSGGSGGAGTNPAGSGGRGGATNGNGKGDSKSPKSPNSPKADGSKGGTSGGSGGGGKNGASGPAGNAGKNGAGTNTKGPGTQPGRADSGKGTKSPSTKDNATNSKGGTQPGAGKGSTGPAGSSGHNSTTPTSGGHSSGLDLKKRNKPTKPQGKGQPDGASPASAQTLNKPQTGKQNVQPQKPGKPFSTRESRETGYRDGTRAAKTVAHAKAYRDGVKDGYADTMQAADREKARLDKAHKERKALKDKEKPVSGSSADFHKPEPIKVTGVTDTHVQLGDGASKGSLSRGEVRSLKVFERRLTERSASMTKAAEDTKGLKAHADEQAAKITKLLEQAKAVKGGEKLTGKLTKLEESAKVQAGKAEEIHKRAVRAADACRTVLANAETRYGGMYKAVVDSDETAPAELKFYLGA